MNEDKLNNEVNNAELEKLNKIKEAYDRMINKKSKFLFCVPESSTPVASVYEIYLHATVVKNMGYEVIILVEKGDYEAPNWIENDLTDFKHIPMSDPNITVSPDSIMVIPEVYTNIMEQTKNLPCLRIGLIQSMDYMMNSLIPGTDLTSFGITELITTSETMKELLNIYFQNKHNIQTYELGIPDYFKKLDIPQKPIISVVGRNPNEISKFVKLFYSKYPQYKWVTFDPMLTNSKPPQPMRRKDFAERLANNFAGVWVDRISSFGTFPLECMKVGTIPICLKPDIFPEYMIERSEDETTGKVIENAGIWSENYYDLPILAGELLSRFLDDNIPTEIYNSMNKVAEKHTQSKAKEMLTEIYLGYIENRKKQLELILNNNK